MREEESKDVGENGGGLGKHPRKVLTPQVLATRAVAITPAAERPLKQGLGVRGRAPQGLVAITPAAERPLKLFFRVGDRGCCLQVAITPAAERPLKPFVALTIGDHVEVPSQSPRPRSGH